MRAHRPTKVVKDPILDPGQAVAARSQTERRSDCSISAKTVARHCEVRSTEAITIEQSAAARDSFAPLAMTR
jgi:hypothetical protein